MLFSVSIRLAISSDSLVAASRAAIVIHSVAVAAAALNGKHRIEVEPKIVNHINRPRRRGLLWAIGFVAERIDEQMNRTWRRYAVRKQLTKIANSPIYLVRTSLSFSLSTELSELPAHHKRTKQTTLCEIFLAAAATRNRHLKSDIIVCFLLRIRTQISFALVSRTAERIASVQSEPTLSATSFRQSARNSFD